MIYWLNADLSVADTLLLMLYRWLQYWVWNKVVPDETEAFAAAFNVPPPQEWSKLHSVLVGSYFVFWVFLTTPVHSGEDLVFNKDTLPFYIWEPLVVLAQRLLMQWEWEVFMILI